MSRRFNSGSSEKARSLSEADQRQAGKRVSPPPARPDWSTDFGKVGNVDGHDNEWPHYPPSSSSRMLEPGRIIHRHHHRGCSMCFCQTFIDAKGALDPAVAEDDCIVELN